jgi:hypothetical protein
MITEIRQATADDAQAIHDLHTRSVRTIKLETSGDYIALERMICL